MKFQATLATFFLLNQVGTYFQISLTRGTGGATNKFENRNEKKDTEKGFHDQMKYTYWFF